MKVKFTLEDVKTFLAEQGYDWTGKVNFPGKKDETPEEETLYYLVNWLLNPSLLFNGENKTKFWLDIVYLSEFEFKMSTKDSKMIDKDLSFAWQEYLIEKSPEFKPEVLEHAQQDLKSIDDALGYGYITEEQHKQKRDDLLSFITKLEAGKTI